MKIGFIGAGRVGTAMGMYFRKNSFALSGYFSRSLASSRKAAAMTDSTCYTALDSLCADSDMIFITTGDDQIEKACEQLCQEAQPGEGQIIVHMSGALPSTVLGAAKAFGCSIYSMHPLLAFADIQKSVSDLPNAYFCIEGDDKRLHIIENLLQACGNPYFTLKPEQKTLYHAAACMLSNFLVTLVHSGMNLMENIAVDRAVAFEAMLPLMNNTLQNILELDAPQALTGPIARGDVSTVAKQLAAISSGSGEQLPMFAFMAQETLKLATKSKLSSSQKADKLQSIIQSYL